MEVAGAVGRDRTASGAGDGDGEGRLLFWGAAALALVLHAALLLSADDLRGGADLVPQLRLIQWMGESPALRNVYAPVYHVVGALLAPLVGLDVYPRVFAFASAVALILAFRYFQRAAGLPDASAAVFALSPYALTLSYCIPKVEFAGHAVGLLGLGLLVRRRYVGVAIATAFALTLHTAAALVFGFAAGLVALASRDLRGIAALAAGTLAASPLFAAHVLAGCSLPEALLFSRSGYVGAQRGPLVPEGWPALLALANPIAIGAAAAGAAALWRRSRPLAVMGLALVLLYLNNVYLAPFGIRLAVGLHRGLSVLAIPVAIAAGVSVAGSVQARRALVLACALWAAGCAVYAVPNSCFVRPISLAELEGLRVGRCQFAWQRARPPRGGRALRRPGVRGAPQRGPAAPQEGARREAPGYRP